MNAPRLAWPEIAAAMPTSFECSKHGTYPARTADGRAQQWDCPACNEEARKAVQEWRAAWDLFSRWQATGVPARFRSRRFENFHARTPALKAIAQAVERFACGDGSNGPTALALVGNVGLGKTHLIAAALARLVRQQFSARYVTASDFFTRLRSTFDKDAEDTSARVLAEYDRVSILAIDEIGATAGSEWERQTLSALVDSRYANGGGLILAGNIPPGDLARFIGERGADRFREFGAVLTFAGESYRSKAADDSALLAAADDFEQPPTTFEFAVTRGGKPERWTETRNTGGRRELA